MNCISAAHLPFYLTKWTAVTIAETLGCRIRLEAFCGILLAMLNSFWIFISTLAVALIAPAVAHALKLADFRQAWINELRKDLADYMGLARKWARGWEQYSDLVSKSAPEPDLAAKRDEVTAVFTEAKVLLWRIMMRINPIENENKALDDEFLRSVSALTDYNLVDPEAPGVPRRWNELAEAAVEQSRLLLKREWKVTKQLPIERPLRKLKLYSLPPRNNARSKAAADFARSADSPQTLQRMAIDSPGNGRSASSDRDSILCNCAS